MKSSSSLGDDGFVYEKNKINTAHTQQFYSHKRYERLLKSHGVTATSKTPTKSTKTVADAEAERSSPAGTPTAVRKRPASSTSSPNKKSKTNKAASVKKEEVGEGEDPVKREEVDEQEDPVKEEETEESALSGMLSLCGFCL